MRRQPGEPHVYFLRAIGGFGPVKIGYSTLPEERLRSIAIWAPYPLEIAARTPGDGKLERRFHTQFREHHSHHEWFHACPAIERAIEQINAGSFDFAALPEKGRLLPGTSRGAWSDTQRERLSLNARVRMGAERHGIASPESIESGIARYEKLSDAERASLKAEVEAHLADPLARGRVYPSAQAQKRAAAFLASRAA